MTEAAQNTAATAEESKYPALGKTFMRGKFEGQVKSAHKDRESNPAKAADFVKAVQAGDIAFPADGVTKVVADKLKELGLEVGEQYIKASAPRGRKSEG